jgi:hypothetical protein
MQRTSMPRFAEPLREDVDHLPELEFGRSLQAHGSFPFRSARRPARVLEVEALRELAIGLVDGIGEFVTVEFGDGVE